jgi:uncharacterized surface protein with fasciclin (FAS1) repeats
MKIQKLHSAKNVNGQDVKICINDCTLMMDGAAVIAADIMTGNGVIHVIGEFVSPN